MHYAIKMFMADLVMYLSTLAWCWHMGWKYAFAGIGAFAAIYLTKGMIRIIKLHYTLKRMDQEIREGWDDWDED